MDIGKMTVVELLPQLKAIAKQYGLRLNRAKDFSLARVLLSVMYNREYP